MKTIPQMLDTREEARKRIEAERRFWNLVVFVWMAIALLVASGFVAHIVSKAIAQAAHDAVNVEPQKW